MATIEARITKVEQQEGSQWATIYTDNPDVAKLTTSIAAKVREAGALKRSGEVALIQYSHKQRHDDATGRTYDNYYYERAQTRAPEAHEDDTGIDTVPVDSGSNTYRKTDPEDARRMARSTAGYLTLQTLPLMEQKDPETQLRIADFWERYIMGEITYRNFAGATFAETPTGRANGPGAYSEPDNWEAPPPPGDDDIPF